MFDQFKNLANLPGMMARAKEMQEKLKQMQDELGGKTVSADAGGGMVSATVNGKMQIVKVRIDRHRLGTDTGEGKTQLSGDDVDMLEDLIVAAITLAQQKAQEMIQQEMGKLAGDMGLPPGVLPTLG